MKRTMCPALALVLVLLVAAKPSFAQDAAATPENPTVMSYLEASKSTSFSKMVKMLGVEKLLEDGNFTIFVPTDAAFASFLKAMNISAIDDPFFLETYPVLDLLRYHVSPQALTTDVLPHGTRIQTFLKSATTTDKLRLAVDTKAAAGKVVIRGWESFATVVTANVKAGKNIIHVVDKVLLPKLYRDMGFYPDTLLDMMTFHKASYFQAAVGTVGQDFWDQLKNLPTPATIMMPTDEAFVKALTALGGSLDAAKPKLAKLMNYHIAHGYGPTARMIAGSSIKTWNADRPWNFTYTPTGGIEVVGDKSKANIIIKDSFNARGSVVHVIDTVLIPSNL